MPSDKHGPAHDDYLSREAQRLVRGGGPTHAGEWKEGEPAPQPPGREPGAPRGMSPVDVARRAELSRHLPPGKFPADRARLLAHLGDAGAPDSVVEAISGLPADREFHTIGEVVRALGLTTER